MRALLLATSLIVLLVPTPGSSSADDYDRARAAVAAGRILPLTEIVERATAEFGGGVLDAEYEDDDDEEDDDHHRERSNRSHYRIKLLTPDGRVLKLVYDAVSGELISRHGRHRERHRGGRDDDEDD
ncbi:MAG: PepSY domain-containing protein [Rhodospirillales bacterium]|nr:PepSY domain-containing protein [Rhodospirillales bacterium]